MQEVDVRTVNIVELTDLRDIQIDTKLPVEEKLRLFAEQTNNLHIHRIGDYVVKVRIQEEGPSIDDKVEEYLRHLAEIYILYSCQLEFKNTFKRIDFVYVNDIIKQNTCSAPKVHTCPIKSIKC